MDALTSSQRVPNWSTAGTLLIFVVVAYQVYWYIYNLYFHPLAKFPGPRLWAASRIPHELAYTRGRIVKELSALHEIYGDVVRVSPTSLSFGHPDAWLDIYTHKVGKTLFAKDPTRYTRDLWINGEPEVFTAPDSEHTRLRRVLAPAFSDRAIREQETLIQAHVNLLIKGLKGLAHNTETKGNADLSTWLNWATFDITGDLAFGEPFGCLEEGKYHPWVALVFESVWAVSIMGAIKQFPWINFAFESLMGGMMRRTLTHHAQLAIEKVDRRLAKKEGRGDFLDAIMKHSGSEKEFTQGEIYSNANLLIMAGSETSAAAMSGCLYHLATNPQVLRRLTDEIRGKFLTEQDITFEAAVNLKYMTAVLQESMRLYPAQPIFTPRKVPQGGAIVAGHPVPQDTTVGIYQTVAYHMTKNFRDPESFEPGRWLGDAQFADDRKGIFKPFSTGPKNCIGKELAYNEMRLIIARLIWNFDMSLCDESKNWTNQKVYWSWDRPPLMMHLSERSK